VAGFLLSFLAPSALQTALVLRQAIWRKEHAGWPKPNIDTGGEFPLGGCRARLRVGWGLQRSRCPGLLRLQSNSPPVSTLTLVANS
jgi:hypothetical protein